MQLSFIKNNQWRLYLAPLLNCILKLQLAFLFWIWRWFKWKSSLVSGLLQTHYLVLCLLSGHASLITHMYKGWSSNVTSKLWWDTWHCMCDIQTGQLLLLQFDLLIASLAFRPKKHSKSWVWWSFSKTSRFFIGLNFQTFPKLVCMPSCRWRKHH